MDEFFQIEKCLGEVTATVSLTFEKEALHVEGDYDKEEFEVPEEAVKEVKPAGEGEDEEEPVEAPADEGGEEGEGKAEKFDPSKFQWTKSNKQSKNLLTLFTNLRPINILSDLRDAENYSKQHY